MQSQPATNNQQSPQQQQGLAAAMAKLCTAAKGTDCSCLHPAGYPVPPERPVTRGQAEGTGFATSAP